MTQAKPRLPHELSGLTRSELEHLIHEANLGQEDAEVARRYFIDKECQIDIAIDKDTDRTHICRVVKRSRSKLQEVYRKISS